MPFIEPINLYVEAHPLSSLNCNIHDETLPASSGASRTPPKPRRLSPYPMPLDKALRDFRARSHSSSTNSISSSSDIIERIEQDDSSDEESDTSMVLGSRRRSISCSWDDESLQPSASNAPCGTTKPIQLQKLEKLARDAEREAEREADPSHDEDGAEPPQSKRKGRFWLNASWARTASWFTIVQFHGALAISAGVPALVLKSISPAFGLYSDGICRNNCRRSGGTEHSFQSMKP
ncbi:hypothetical protein BT96DRAFT_996464 [Gymnopus androsaceus JB14]|uniref:Uncharacterized protein n=1 Tax=Gymnopus androsaceus JB14 TaxID=1447944 RepID=A0A6A4HG40_9AGAR|nr:hypothetical protein BT96DRAFT_996464 [Gymnopus androsaceus JB14]